MRLPWLPPGVIGEARRRLAEPWERDRRETLVLMGAIALAFLPHLAHRSAWVSLGFVALFLWRAGLVLSGKPLPGTAVRLVAAGGCAAAVLAQFGTLLGREPGVSMLVLLMGLKLLELRARRDLFVVIFLALFLLLTSFLDAQTLAAAAMVTVAVTGLLTAMLTMQPTRIERPFRLRVRGALKLLLQALPVAALLFVLFPRVSGPLWRLPIDAHRGVTGLSDTMSPGRIASLAESDEIAFRVRFESDPPAGRQLYWRGPVLANFDGKTWRPVSRRGGPPESPPDIAAGSPATRYAVTLEPNGQPWLLVLETPVSLDMPSNPAMQLTGDLQAIANEPVVNRIRYSAEARDGARFGADESPERLARYLRLPTGFDPRAISMARAWAALEPDDTRRIDRALAHFRNEPFRYTLEPPLLGRDTIDDFLFRTRAGFCEHYASALVVLARAMGVPARVVTGYLGGERNPVDGYWTIRQSDAHAWAEVWFQGRGWTRVDATAAIAPERVDLSARAIRTGARDDAWTPSLLQRFRFGVDAVANAWNQWVLAYDTDRQRNLLARIGLPDADWTTMAGALAIGLTCVMGLLALGTFASARREAAEVRTYARFCTKLARVGIVRTPSETPNGLLTRAAGVLSPQRTAQAAAIVTLYNALRYGVDDANRLDRVRHLARLVEDFEP